MRFFRIRHQRRNARPQVSKRVGTTRLGELRLSEKQKMVLVGLERRGQRVTSGRKLLRREHPARMWVNRPKAVDRLPFLLGVLRRRAVVPEVSKKGPAFAFERRRPQVPKKLRGENDLCKRREERREVLFAVGTAGRGRRRSPGQGGSYRRTEDSNYSCQ